jgi:hypothetical protein
MPWYVSFQKGQRGLAPVHPEPAASLVHVLLDGGLRKAEPDGDFLVGEESRESQTLFLSCAEALQHLTLRTSEDC